MMSKYGINLLKVNVCLQISVLFTFIGTTIFAHPHQNNALEMQPHTHPQNENNLMYDLDEFNDLDSQSSNPSSTPKSKQNQDLKNLILLDDNLYLLDDDFDFGNNEFDLHKIELNNNDLEIAKEYKDFLNFLAKEDVRKGKKTSSSNSYNKKQFVGLNGRINSLEAEKLGLEQKIENLEKQFQSTTIENTRVKELEAEKLGLEQKIANLEKQLQSTTIENTRVKELEAEKLGLEQKIANLEKQFQSSISDKSYDDLKTSYDDLKKRLENLNKSPQHNENTVKFSNSQKYRVSVIIGVTVPIISPYGVGPNFGIRFDTPFSFNIVKMKAKVGTEIYLSTMSPTEESSDDFDFINNSYFLANIVGNVSITPFYRMNNQHLSSMEIISGLGITSASISQDRKTTLSTHLDINYYIPKDLSGFKIGFNLHTQITMGHAQEKNTTSLINASILIKTPLWF